jgi:CRISPR-associated protein Cas2
MRQLQCLRWELTELLTADDDVLMIPLCPRCVDGIRSTHSAAKDPDWPETPPGHTIV